jgi:protein-S-isoprenylcysteine O-methyltransferase Ste14
MPAARVLRSLVLPLLVAGVIPFLLIARWNPARVAVAQPLPAAQIIGGLVLGFAGLALLAVTIRRFAVDGAGTLAPWDPPRHFVVRGPYGYVRNPMISGVLLLLLGEAIVCGSGALLAWFAAVLAINTAYFKLSEEPGLVRRFGAEYENYRQHVPMWVPRLKPWVPDRKD